MFKIIHWIIFFCLIEAKPQAFDDFYTAINSIDGDSILKHFHFLASDSVQGRGLGSQGIEIAAKYISNKFQQYGLKPNPKSNNYFQEIPMHGSLPLNSSELKIYNLDSVITLRYSQDYYLYKAGQQTYIPSPLEMVFVGYGIVAPEYDYNDYQTVDVTGKIVVYLDNEPKSEDPDYFNGQNPTHYSFAEVKRQIALSRGAAGTIIIPFENYTDWNFVKRDFDLEDINLAYSITSNLSLIINPECVNHIFKDSGYYFEDIVKMYYSHKMKSFELKTRLSFKGAFKERNFVEKNIIGFIPGVDTKLKDTYLIISAHYDHLGIGIPVNGDSIYNGALDNAIGVSVLMEIARVFSKLSVAPKRTVIFIAFTGEEKGLLGSTYYCDNPVFPLYKTIANVNIDGIAFFRDFKSIVGVGAQYSSLEDKLLETANRYQLTVEDIPDEFNSITAFTNSDNYAFALNGVPSILILEGISNKTKSREEVIEAFIDFYLNRYHTPLDDLNQYIDIVAAERHAKIIFDFCFSLSNSSIAPEWKKDAPFLKAKLRNIAEKR
uniref:M28 family peptidase n=1 Tax=Ignavibacterium album TaxID=591197 RepID=A0A832DMP2_9BACT